MTSAEHALFCPILIGRTEAMRQAQRLIESAQRRQAQVLVISGEAGAGKSRLVTEIRARVAPLGFVTLSGYCFEADQTVPYAPLIDLLRNFCLVHTPAEIAQAVGPAGPELVKLVPELGRLVPALAPSSPLEPAAERLRLFQSLAGLLARQATEHPLLVLIEDLHWSDDLSLDFLYHLARGKLQGACLLLLTHRSEDEHGGLKDFLAKFERERLAQDVSLGPLSRAEVARMLEAIFQLQEPVRADFLDALYGLTEGNPFFIEEVLRSLLAAGDISYIGGRWERKPVDALRVPRTVQVAVQRRTDGLRPAAKQLLAVAAVAGRRFDYALLQRALQQLDPALDEGALLELLKELVAAQLLVEAEGDQFAFRHALTQEAVFRDMLARERRPLHTVVAEALEQVYSSALEPHLASLAGHYDQAGVWSRALDYARRAGEHAARLYAPRAAIEQFSLALRAAGHLPAVSKAPLRLARGAAYELLDQFEAARADYEQALADARTAGDRAAGCQALLALGFLWSARDIQRAGVYLQSALDQARSQDEAALLGHSLNRIGNWHLNMERPGEARRLHQEALAVFERLGDRRGVAETLDLLATTAISLVDLAQGQAGYGRAVSLFRELGDRPALASCLTMLALCGPQYLSNVAVWPRDTGEAQIRAGREALQILQDIGWRSGEALAQINLGMVLGFRGEYEPGLAALAAGLEIAIDVEHAYWQTMGHLALGAAYLDLMQLSAAEAHLQRALALTRLAGSTYWMRTVLGFLVPVQLALGHPDIARASLAGNLPAPSAMRTMGERLAWAAQVELCLAEGAFQQALDIADNLVAWAPSGGEGAAPAPPRLAWLRGRALMGQNRFEEAESALLDARSGAQTAGVQPMLWHLSSELANLYHKIGRANEARRERAEAESALHDLAGRIPDGPLSTVTLALLSGPATRPASLRASFLDATLAQRPAQPAVSAREQAKQEYGGLTARERQVAAMVAEGLSNRAMAGALVVSERTVEKHVENILSKLGFTSRAQIAAWAVEKGLRRPDRR